MKLHAVQTCAVLEVARPSTFAIVTFMKIKEI